MEDRRREMLSSIAAERTNCNTILPQYGLPLLRHEVILTPSDTMNAFGAHRSVL